MPSRSLASRKKLLLLFVRWGSIGSMAYQFNHIESYGRTAGKGKQGGHSLTSIIAEVERIDGPCNHVENPKPPILLDGVMPHDAQKMAEKWAETVTDARGHKLRKDALCMIGGVISFPDGYENWDGYKKDAIKWLKTEFGEGLKSVVEHTDEGHHHIHFYVVAKDGERFESIHKGLKAGNAVDPKRGERGRDKVEAGNMRQKARNAYKSEMGLYQDRFYDEVSKKYGLLRLGPKKRRLPNSQYKAEIREAKHQAKLMAEIQAENARLKAFEAQIYEQSIKFNALNTEIQTKGAALREREKALETEQNKLKSLKNEVLDHAQENLTESNRLKKYEQQVTNAKTLCENDFKANFMKGMWLSDICRGLPAEVLQQNWAKFAEMNEISRQSLKTTPSKTITPPRDNSQGMSM